MRVLVTRPENRVSGTVAKLEELGHEAANFPLFAPVHDRAAMDRALATPHAAIAVTSAEAVRGLEQLGDGLTPHLGTRLFAVGRMTARAARLAGFTRIESSSGGGLELGQLIVAHYAAAGTRRREREARRRRRLRAPPRTRRGARIRSATLAA